MASKYVLLKSSLMHTAKTDRQTQKAWDYLFGFIVASPYIYQHVPLLQVAVPILNFKRTKMISTTSDLKL